MQRGVTRRQMMMGAGAVAPLALLGLAACTGSDDEGAAASSTPTSTHYGGGTTVVSVTDAGPVVAPKYPHRAYPARAPRRSSSRTHRLDWVVDEHLREVAHERTMLAWTFAERGKPGRVPGPVVRVTEGDRIRFALENTGSLPHSMDFHAAKISWSRAYQPVLPGKSAEFTWDAKVPGVFMWHCGVPPVLLHVGQGQYGMVIVDPADDGLLPPAREFAIVQSDVYPGPNGEVSNLERMQRGDPELVVFNGYANQYTGPDALRIRVGERVRVFFLNAGPSRWSAFHVIGALFDRVFYDGIYPENLMRGWQTLNLAPSQGAVVEFTVEEEGTYPFVTHDFHDASKGALGYFTTNGEKTGGAGHG